MENEKKIKQAFCSYIELSGLWDKIKGNLHFKIDAVARDIRLASFIGNREYVTFEINAIYTYFDPDNSNNIIWQKSAIFEETWLEKTGEFAIGDKGLTNLEFCDARATDKNFFTNLSIPLLEILCNYFDIDKDMLINNSDKLNYLYSNIFKSNLELERINKSLEQKMTIMENLADEINKDTKIQSETLEKVKKLRNDFSSIIKQTN